MLLEAATDDFEDPDTVRKHLRGLREVRMSKLRKGVEVLDAGGGVQMNGVGGMEVAEGRAFITGVIDNLRYVLSQAWIVWACFVLTSGRKIGTSREQQHKERNEENGYPGTADDYDDDEMDMQ